MSERREAGDAPSSSSAPSETAAAKPGRLLDALLYAGAAISYVALAVHNKWLLNWVVGPGWLVAWVWGIPALGRLLRGRPVRPRRGP